MSWDTMIEPCLVRPTVRLLFCRSAPFALAFSLGYPLDYLCCFVCGKATSLIRCASTFSPLLKLEEMAARLT